MRGSMGRPLIIGQAPARGNDGLLPFAGQSGARLAQLAGVGDSGDDLYWVFDLVNLIERYPGKKGKKGDAFDMKEAQSTAVILRRLLSGMPQRRILLMGNQVTKACGVRRFQTDYLHMVDTWVANRGAHIVYRFPHPSGVSRWWNDPKNEQRASHFLHRLIANG